MILGACNSRAWSGAGAQVLCNVGRRHPDANVFRRLQQSLRETLSVAQRHLRMEATHDLCKHQTKRRHNCTRETRALEMFRRNCNRIRLYQQNAREVLPDNQLHKYYYSQSALLFPDYRVLWTQFF